MDRYRKQEYWIISFSFLIAAVMQIILYSYNIQVFQPNGLLLILLYWIFVAPYRTNVGTGFFIGAILDMISGSTFGIHTLAMSIVAYLAAIKFQIYRNVTLWQQTILVIVLSFTADCIIFLEEFLVINVHFHPKIFLSSVDNGMLWPCLLFLMHKIRKKFLIL